MIKFILMVMVLSEGAVAPVGEFNDGEYCKLVANQLSTHPENQGQVAFTCHKVTEV